MKNLLCIFSILASLSISINACKKCYTCTNQCGTCFIAGASSDTVCTGSGNGTLYDTYKAACNASGGTWKIVNNTSTSFCSANHNDVTAAEINCTDNGGTWAQK